ncbi:MAG: phosphoribosylformylglycinamidine cyclo-ligase [Candidatus Veblenbacteria bacterium]|nr:phosphoribosylformylglycinamidine cyclo-ligase [Candidatus Veblenbacteria bacterium]
MPLDYKAAGVDIDNADATKGRMAEVLQSSDSRVLNRLGAFGSLFQAKFPGIADPVLVLKSEEPGSKQLLAHKYGRHRSIAFDTINHLINDIAVMGATPLVALDTIVIGKINKEVVMQLVTGMSEACQEQGCTLVGGETSEQPGVLEQDRYVLTATAVGVVDRERITDGSKIQVGDTVIALAANGLHTNGYSLVRKLLEKHPGLEQEEVGGETFLEAIMKPHLCYYRGLQKVFPNSALVGLAHITGGGIRDNLKRVLPAQVDAQVDLSRLRIPPVFRTVRERAEATDEEMLHVYNLGVGMVVVARAEGAGKIINELQASGYGAYEIGQTTVGSGEVQFRGSLKW